MTRLGPDQRAGYKRIGVVKGYDKWAGKYDQDPNPLIALEEKVTLSFIGDVLGQQVLDLGCGTGRYCVHLAERGAKVAGVDPSWGMLERAKQKVTSGYPFALFHGTLKELRFPDEHFDLVLSALTLCHLPDLEPTLKEAVRVIKNGGRLIISDIHPYWPVSGHDYTEFFDEAGQEYRIPVYPHLLEEYWHLFRKFGLHLEEIREPKVDDWLIERFPSLKDYLGIPLAMVMRARKFLLVPPVALPGSAVPRLV